jgi:hemolysin III
MRRLQSWIKEPFPAISHFVGAILAVGALLLLLLHTHGRVSLIVSFAIYGSTLIALYTASAIAHALHVSPQTSAKLDRIDYAAIFLLIAGTYTPLCLVTLRGPWGWSIFGVEWGMAGIGILLVSVGRGCSDWVRVGIYCAMGWLAMIAISPLLAALPGGALAWLLAGGICYSVGAVIFAMDRPHLWPGVFHAHDLWHVLVLGGSACHFLLVFRFVAVS